MIHWSNKVQKGETIWSGVRKEDSIELRKTFIKTPHYAQMLIVIRDGGVEMSMNGKAAMSVKDFIEIAEVIKEVQENELQ